MTYITCRLPAKNQSATEPPYAIVIIIIIAKIKMSDGQRSGRSTGRVSCKSTELKRCSMIEIIIN